ncbi:helix-turn-helix domain-containing protein [Aromatoleum buckelii]|uniref:Helix-turn-helix domain-containing protein n=1 Tax=Aromatoleum buckelii TaxID=200254 RepID=A0ABX1N853_9RHOO|nr:helix-turn-helix transcriptional regulator [Aromatoleum buckelii]MCK0509516.1 helix-turn-helix domain-containing protein [Aromatoleum buckelii]
MPPAKTSNFWFQTNADVVARRKMLGLNQSEFWMRLGITQSGASRYESGRTIPNPVKILLQVAYGSDAQMIVTVAELREMPKQPEKQPERRPQKLAAKKAPRTNDQPRGFGYLP